MSAIVITMLYIIHLAIVDVHIRSIDTNGYYPVSHYY